MILPVRPHYIFDKTAGSLVTIPIPERQVGSPSLLETFLIIGVGLIVEPDFIFEIGTFGGQTAKNLARHFIIPVITLDLDQSRAGDLSEYGVTQKVGHSIQFDFSPWYGKCGLVFVDGGHDYDTVKSDTQNALKLLTPDGAIVWHDYGNILFPDVTRYLQELNLPILHVGDTQLAIYFRGDK